jgi:hypothetical protein
MTRRRRTAEDRRIRWLLIGVAVGVGLYAGLFTWWGVTS